MKGFKMAIVERITKIVSNYESQLRQPEHASQKDFQ